tara:strand:- start:289 stop:672 length:384 start_codon:yes stop_codon:yes gene_type:complete
MSRSSDAMIAQVHDWMERFVTLMKVHDQIRWEIGDHMQQEAAMPEEVSQVFPASDKVLHTIRQYQECAAKYPECERHDEVRWNHHWMVRDREDRHDWLKLVAENDIGEYVLRDMLNQEKQDDNRNAR